VHRARPIPHTRNRLVHRAQIVPPHADRALRRPHFPSGHCGGGKPERRDWRVVAHVVLDVNLWHEAKRTNFLLRSADHSRRGRREPRRKRFSELPLGFSTAIAVFGLKEELRAQASQGAATFLSPTFAREAPDHLPVERTFDLRFAFCLRRQECLRRSSIVAAPCTSSHYRKLLLATALTSRRGRREPRRKRVPDAAIRIRTLGVQEP
jgi:hypothetical protein